MKWLEELLGDIENKDDLIKDIKSNLAKEFVPKSEFNAKNDEVKELKEQVSDRDTQLEDLKKSVEGNDDLISKIEKLEDENKKVKEDYESKITSMKKKQIASSLLLDSKAKDIDVNLALFNLDEFELDEESNKLVGFEDAIAKHKEEYSFLYEDKDNKKYKGFQPIDSSNSGDDNVDTSIGSQFAKARSKSSEPKNSLWK